MLSVEQAVQKLVEKLELEPQQHKDVERQHRVVRDVVRKRLGTKTEFLSGSYSRGTAIRPLHDVDLFAVFEGAGTQGASGRGGGGGGKGATPDEVLKSIRQAFREEWPGRQLPLLQGHSVGIDFSSSGISIDVVPAYALGANGGFLIPERDTESWIHTDPRAHQDACKRANDRAGSRLNPLIKLVKHWNRQRAPSSPLRSFHLEAMCYEAFPTPPQGSHLELFATLLSFLAERVLRPCKDPAGVGADVDARMTAGQREAARNQLQGAAKEARLAFQERSSHLEQAHARLGGLFGSMYQKREP